MWNHDPGTPAIYLAYANARFKWRIDIGFTLRSLGTSQPASRPRLAPVFAQQIEEAWRKRGLSIPPTFALFDMDHDPVAIDIQILDFVNFGYALLRVGLAPADNARFPPNMPKMPQLRTIEITIACSHPDKNLWSAWGGQIRSILDCRIGRRLTWNPPDAPSCSR